MSTGTREGKELERSAVAQRDLLAMRLAADRMAKVLTRLLDQGKDDDSKLAGGHA